MPVLSLSGLTLTLTLNLRTPQRGNDSRIQISEAPSVDSTACR